MFCVCVDFDSPLFFDSHRNESELLASALLEKETLFGVEIKELIKFKQSDAREPKHFIFQINRNNTFSFNGKPYNNNNGGGGGNGGNGGSSNKKSNDNTNDLKGFPETDLLNPQPSMFIRKNQIKVRMKIQIFK